jgi:hypothetical protein
MLVSSGLVAGCSGSGAHGGPDTSDASSDDLAQTGPFGSPDAFVPGMGVHHSYAPTYDAIWKEILQPICATDVCHAGSGDYLQLQSEAIGYASLVNAPAQGPMCAATGLRRVEPFHPETSLFYLKVTNPPCGSKMPLLYGLTLDIRETTQIREWIACGALDGDGGCTPEGGEADAAADGVSADDGGPLDAAADMNASDALATE